MSEPTRATIRQRFTAFLIAGLGGLLASAVSFSMAIYEAGHPPQTPVAMIGDEIDTGRWFVTLRAAHVGPVPPTGIKPSDPGQLLMLDMDVVNRGATPNNLVSRTVKISAPAVELDAPTVYLDRDKYIAGYFNPDMPERVTVAWQWPADRPVPERLTVTVNGQIYKLRDNLYGASGWYDHDPVATVDMPVEKTP